MTLPRHIRHTYKHYTNKWPVLHFFNALVHDPQLAMDFEQADDGGGKDEILVYFGLDPNKHRDLFIPQGEPHPLTPEEISKILAAAQAEIVAIPPTNFW